MLLITKVMSQFSIEGAFDQSFGELLEQAVLTEQVFRLRDSIKFLSIEIRRLFGRDKNKCV